MKRFPQMLAVLMLGASLAAGSATAGVGIRVSGGLDRVFYGDYNDYVDQLNDVVFPLLGVTGEIDNIHWVPELRGEVLFSYLPRTTIGVGFGVISGKSSCSIDYSGGGIDFEHTVKAYPICATAYVSFPVPFAFMKPYVFGGVGVYRTKITFEQSTSVDTLSYEADLDKTGFGLHGGFGTEVSVTPMVAVDFEFIGRWAKMKGFEGTATRGDGVSQDVFLARYEEKGLLNFGWASIKEKSAYPEGVVDLSGFGFSLGLKVAF